MYKIAAFYKFADLSDYKDIREKFYQKSLELDLRGTILVAPEGINATISGTERSLDEMIEFIKEDPRFEDMDVKFSWDEDIPFYRMKVKLKKEIITFCCNEIDPVNKVGEYVEPSRWNYIISDPEVVLVDTRNDYEYKVGTFKGAINPNIKSFTEFAEFVEKHLDPQKHKKVAMFCTGGIRCEKATSYLLSKGFERVYHLKGGILKYLEEIPEEQSLWEGECFVFDGRVSVKHGLKKGEYELCGNCRNPISPQEKESERYEKGVFCPECYDNLTPQRIASLRERQRQIELAGRRNATHIGWGKPRVDVG